jgi:peroxiredoxin
MIELGQLERHHDEFARRSTRVIAVSIEGLDAAAKTQAAYGHLLVLADHERGLSEAAGVIHAASAPDGSDTSAPTTILVDRHGKVRWLYRSAEVVGRLSPEEVAQAIDQYLVAAER